MLRRIKRYLCCGCCDGGGAKDGNEEDESYQRSRLLMLKFLKVADVINETIEDVDNDFNIVSESAMKELKETNRFLIFKISKDLLQSYYYPSTAIMESSEFDEDTYYDVEQIIKVPHSKKMVLVVDVSH